MYIDNNLLTTYQKISMKCECPNQVLDVMIHATEDTIKTYKCRSKCWLLRELKYEGVGANEVEYTVERIWRVMTTAGKEQTKKRILSHPQEVCCFK